MSGRKPAALNFPDMPKEYQYIRDWFVKIKNSGEVNLLTIDAFARLMRIDIKPSEVNMILEFDLVYREALHG